MNALGVAALACGVLLAGTACGSAAEESCARYLLWAQNHADTMAVILSDAPGPALGKCGDWLALPARNAATPNPDTSRD